MGWGCEGDLHHLAPGEGTAAQPLAEGLPLEQLGDQEGRAVVGPCVVDYQDVGVAERPGRARLLLEAAQALGVAGGGRASRAGRVPGLAIATWV
jgi:hypothetical protein